jgi:hypothetical protein
MPLTKIINITMKTQEITQNMFIMYDNKIRSMSEEIEDQKRRIRSLENINIQNDLIIQELRVQFLEEIKRKKF